MRIVFLVAFLLSACEEASSQSISEKARKDQIVFMKDEAPAMRRAFALAKSSLDDFLARARHPAAGTKTYSVKVAISEGSNTEYFWVIDFTESKNGFSGTINNDPQLVDTVKNGQIYHFDRAQIVDWTYYDTKAKRLRGNFTACALLTEQPKAEAESFKRETGLVCP